MSDILRPLTNLGTDPAPESIEGALHDLRVQCESEPPERIEILRRSACKALLDAGIKGPARIVDSFLSPALKPGAVPESGPEKEVQPWPEAVSGEALLEDIVRFITRFVVLPKGAPTACALWVVFAHVQGAGAFGISPILLVQSPTKRCGKTALLETLSLLVPRPLMISNITSAALFRSVGDFNPTLLIDEADTFATHKEDLRGIVNSGHRRSSAFVLRCTGDDHRAVKFSTWCPKVIALIGNLSDTLEDRSIVIPMSRRLDHQAVERLRPDRVDQEATDLTRKCLTWVTDNLGEMNQLDPAIPTELHDRAQDNWRPLISIADLVGGIWPERARLAACTLSASITGGEEGMPVLLLADVRVLFEETGLERISSERILQGLLAREDRPWCEFRQGREITKAGIAKLLKSFGIAPKKVRFGSGTKQGYLSDAFEDAWDRYLPRSGVEQPEQLNRGAGDGRIHTWNTAAGVPLPESSRNPGQDSLVPSVPVAGGGTSPHEGLNGGFTEPPREDEVEL